MTDTVIKEKDLWITKPADAGFGKGVEFGAAHSEKSWMDIIKERTDLDGFIFQKRVTYPTIRVTDIDDDGHLINHRVEYDSCPHHINGAFTGTALTRTNVLEEKGKVKKMNLVGGGIILPVIGAEACPPLQKYYYKILIRSMCIYMCCFICRRTCPFQIGYRYFVTPYELLILRFLIGGIVVLPLVKRYRWIGWKNTAGVLWLALLLMSTCGLVLVALKYLTAVVVITIITATPAFVAIVNQMLGKEILSKRFWIGFLFCFAGILLSIEIHRGTSNSQTFNIIGLLCAFGSVAVSTIYRTQLDDATRTFPPMQVSTYMFIMDAIVALFFLPTVWPMSVNTWVIGSIIGVAALLQI
jgi:hypothetical protein